MIVVTTPYLAGHRITESKGMVFGLVVRSRGLGGNLMASLRSLGGGEIHEYTSLLEDTRRQALDRLVKNATLLGANAVLSMRFDSSELSGTMSEIVAYGTAVIVAPDGSHGRRTDAGRMSCGLRGRPPDRPGRRPDAGRGRPRPARGRGRGRDASPRSWLIGIGIAFIVGALLERVRYRSEATDRSGEPHGPGGGEPAGAASNRVSGAATRSSSTRRRADGCASGSIRRSGERRYVAED